MSLHVCFDDEFLLV